MIKKILLIAFLIFTLAACDSFLSFQKVDVTVIDGGIQSIIPVDKDSTVENALTSAGDKAQCIG